MSWNYRIVRREYEADVVTYGIHEAYYDDESPNQVSALTTEPVWISADSIQGVLWCFEKIKECLQKPVVDYYTREEILVDMSEVEVDGILWSEEGGDYFKDRVPVDDVPQSIQETLKKTTYLAIATIGSR